MQRVQSTPKIEAEIAAILAKPIPSRLMGACAGCQRGIPHGYSPLVTHWKSKEDWKGIPRVVASVMYCRQCPESVAVLHGGVPRAPKPETRPKPPTIHRSELASDLSPKDKAVKMMKVLSRDKILSTRKVAKLAGIAFDDTIKPILRKLRQAGHVRFTSNGLKKGWSRVK